MAKTNLCVIRTFKTLHYYLVFSGLLAFVYLLGSSNLSALHYLVTVGGLDSKASRLQRLQRRCNDTYWSTAPRYGMKSCIANHERRVIFCPFPKVAGTTLKMMMFASTSKCKKEIQGWNASAIYSNSLLQNGQVHRDDLVEQYGMELLQNYSSEQINTKFKDYYKFMFVRNPYDRLLSAFKNKIERKTDIYEMFLHDMNEEVWNNTLPSNATITLADLLDFIIYRLNLGQPVDAHFSPYKNLLNPCGLKFDFIGKIETWTQDAPVILRHLFDEENVEIPQENSSENTKSPKEYYAKIPGAVIKKIHELYKDDFEMYGYSYPDYIKSKL